VVYGEDGFNFGFEVEIAKEIGGEFVDGVNEENIEVGIAVVFYAFEIVCD